MKIILSRKGFDSSYGKGASPIMPNGDLLSIPIPASNNEEGIPYSEVKYGGRSYLEIMERLGMKIPENKKCHLDPDLIEGAYKREEGWLGVFGQAGAAQTHLRNENVEEGDVFLFFGSFKRTIEENGLQFENDYVRHIIFGYLKVGAIIDLKKNAEIPHFKYHPHFRNVELYNPRNTLYVASSKQDFGVFKYRTELVLTRSGFPKSTWSLPDFFHPDEGVSFSRHSEKDFSRREGKVILKSRGIGQDFVIEGNEKVSTWAESLIKGSERFLPDKIEIGNGG